MFPENPVCLSVCLEIGDPLGEVDVLHGSSSSGGGQQIFEFNSFPLINERVCVQVNATRAAVPNIQAIGISLAASSIGYLLVFPLLLLLLSSRE